MGAALVKLSQRLDFCKSALAKCPSHHYRPASFATDDLWRGVQVA